MKELRNTKQREEVLHSVKALCNHPSAEEVYAHVRTNNPNISKGTVYRNLKDLVDEGYIIKISMAGGADRYDYIHKKHNHIICKSCGTVKDFEYNFDLEDVKQSVIKQTEVSPLLDGVIMDGICEKCKEKLKNRMY